MIDIAPAVLKHATVRLFRLLAHLGLIVALAVLAGDAPILIGPVTPGPIALEATASPDKPDFVDETILHFVQGWTLTDPDSVFGGISALQVSGIDFQALGDDGSLFSFALAPGGHVSQANVTGLPDGCGHRAEKKHHDSESWAADPDGTHLWIGFEWANRVCRMTRAKHTTAQQAYPSAMQDWPKTGGAEAMARLSDGRLAIFAERPKDDSRNSPILLFADDPVLFPHPISRVFYRPPEGYRVSDAVALPDGRLLVLVRWFNYPFKFKARLQLVDKPLWRPGTVLQGRDVVRLENGEIGDNYEAVAISSAGGKTSLWLASDDNSFPLQKNWLLKFELIR